MSGKVTLRYDLQKIDQRLPEGVCRIVVKPRFRHKGASMGKDFPFIYGHIRGLGYCIWDKTTGCVQYVSPYKSVLRAANDCLRRCEPVRP